MLSTQQGATMVSISSVGSGIWGIGGWSANHNETLRESSFFLASEFHILLLQLPLVRREGAGVSKTRQYISYALLYIYLYIIFTFCRIDSFGMIPYR